MTIQYIRRILYENSDTSLLATDQFKVIYYISTFNRISLSVLTIISSKEWYI